MNEVEKKVKIGLWRQRIGYGSSDFACNLIWQMISLYLLYFYTNVMHLNAGAVSVMFLVTKVIDGISDLIVGFLIDKTNTKWGKSRPWILFGAIPFGVAAVLAFSVPNIGQTGMLIYAYVSYILLSTAYTVVNIPMASILPALSEDPHERTVLASCRTFFSSIGSTVVSAFALTLVDKFGNGNEALGFRIVMMIFGVIGCLVFFFCFFNKIFPLSVTDIFVDTYDGNQTRFHGMKHFVSYYETVRFKRRNTSFHPVKRTDTVVSYI